MSNSVIRIERVTKTYPVGEGLTVLRDVSLRVEEKEYLGILGPSGSGKSTLLHLVGLLDRPTSGSIFFRDKDVSRLPDGELSELRGRSIGFVFQSFHLVPQLTVLENVELPMFYQRIPARQRSELARSALADVGMDQRARHLPGQLSGGESQRTAIARALATDPDVLLADEPTGNLDSKTGEEIIRLFSSLHDRGRTVIMITHDRSIASRLPRVAQMQDGMIVKDERR